MKTAANTVHRKPWNKGKIVGQKAPFKIKDIWALRVRLQMENRVRELALFNLGIDSKLRGCDLVSLKVRDVCRGDQVASSRRDSEPRTSYFRVAFTTHPTWGLGSTPESSKAGSKSSDLTRRTTARTRCVVPRQL